MYSQYTNSLSKTSTPATECKHKLGTDHLSSKGGGGGYVFFQKKYSDFGGGKKNLIQSFCHIS